MSVLAALARAYDRLPDAPPIGYAPVRIGALVSLRPDGSVASIIDLRDTSGRKQQAPEMLVPQGVKRTVAVAPNFLWDKTAYALGLTAGKGKRIGQEHAAFKKSHAEWLKGTEDEGLNAFLAFLDGWDPEGPMPRGWSDDMLDANVAFALESERLAGIRMHDREAARAAWTTASQSGSDGSLCLITGGRAPAARLHPSVKGVWGAQSSGASLVSFNLDAFTSYGHVQGGNAPVSEDAAFAYGTALNRFLATGSGHRIQVGDASTVFWADASGKVAREAETIFGGLVGGGARRRTTPSRPRRSRASSRPSARAGPCARWRPTWRTACASTSWASRRTPRACRSGSTSTTRSAGSPRTTRRSSRTSPSSPRRASPSRSGACSRNSPSRVSARTCRRASRATGCARSSAAAAIRRRCWQRP